MSTLLARPAGGSPAAPGEIVARVVAEHASRAYGAALRAVILTGSLARGEAAFARREEAWHSPSDAEFFLVLRQASRLPGPGPVEGAVREALVREAVHCRVDLSVTNPRYFRRLRPHIFAYELRTCGRVVWGDASILDLVPSFDPSDIPLEDGWRLLSNRIIEMLEWPDPLPKREDPLPEDVGYRALKLCLDAATSLLLFRGAYAPTYRARAEQLKRLERRAPADEPFPLASFQATVEDLTRVKLEGLPRLPDWDLWRKIVRWALFLWDDELQRLGETSPDSQRMMRRFSGQQRRSEKLRGWLALWRSAGVLAGARVLPRMMRQVFSGSPRYQLYGIATQLLRELPTRVPVPADPDPNDARWRRLRGRLPDPTREPESPDRPSWQQLADDVLRHYRRFLVKTRS